MKTKQKLNVHNNTKHLKRKPLQLLSGEEWERDLGQAGVVDPAAQPGAEVGPQSTGRIVSGLCLERMLISASQDTSSVIPRQGGE